jgi:uncharacterized protein DUF4953
VRAPRSGGGFFAPLPDDPPVSGAALPTPRARAAVRTLHWQGTSPAPLCVLWGLAYQAQAAGAGNQALTGKQKLEAYIQHVVTHEVGHTLGLRHNFKGSLMPPTSSIMEYSVLEAAIAAPTPGPYDRAAIAYLYGKSTALPTQPFATDEDTLSDPDAVRFDAPSPTPLVDYQIPAWSRRSPPTPGPCWSTATVRAASRPAAWWSTRSRRRRTRARSSPCATRATRSPPRSTAWARPTAR